MTSSSEFVYTNVARVLRTGFRIAAAFMLTGFALALIRQEPLKKQVDAIRDIPSELAGLHSSAFIDLAIISIVLTPLAAVITIWFGFRKAGETRFAAYALGVLAILFSSIALSLLR